MQLPLRFLTVALSLLISTAVASSDVVKQNHVELENDRDLDPILPKEPMVIKVEDGAVTITSGRVEYRGCYKFCVGSVSSHPYNENTKVWNPFNQSTNQVYYFRYVEVDMETCKWPRWAKYPYLKIPELFFDTTPSASSSRSRSHNDYVYANDYYDGDSTGADRGSNSNNQYIMSLPTKIENNKFTFLIYHPEISPRNKWTVRWTGFMNSCKANGTLPIDLHYEPDAFDAEDYITFPEW